MYTLQSSALPTELSKATDSGRLQQAYLALPEDHNFSPYLLLSSFPFLFDFLLFSMLAMVGNKNPTIATQSGH